MLFFLIIALYILFSAVITQIFNPTMELAIATEIPTKKAKSKIQTHSISLETKIS